MKQQKLAHSAGKPKSKREIASRGRRPAEKPAVRSDDAVNIPDICRRKGTVRKYREMVALRDQLIGEIEDLGRQQVEVNRHDGIKGWIEASSMNEEGDRLRGVLAAKQVRLNFTELAIRFLGEYGWDGKSCLAQGCHQPIGKQRLEAKPEAIVCTSCRRLAEHGQIRRLSLKFGFTMSLSLAA